MGPEEKYLFDLWGYVNIEGVLGNEELAELNTLIDAQDYRRLLSTTMFIHRDSVDS